MDNFRTLFEFLPIGAYRSTPEGQAIRANAALVRLNGYATEAELLAAVRDIGAEWYVAPGRRDQLRRILESEGQLRGAVSEVYRHKTRERIWVSENAHVVRDAEGRPSFYEGTVEEITERVQSALAVHRSEQHLRQIANHVPGMVYRVHFGPQGQVRYSFVSDGVMQLYGVSPQEVIADPVALRRFRHPDDAERVDRVVQAAIASRAPIAVDYRVVCDDGQVKWLQMSSSVAADEGDEQVRVGVLLDVTAQRDGAQLRAERDRAATAQRAMTQFLSRVSHELRTPLNAILGFAQLIDTDSATALHQRQWVQELLSSGEHLLSLVEDILDLSGAQSGQLQIDLTEVPLAEVIDECRVMLDAAAAAMALRWVQEGLGAEMLAVRADRKRLKQVVLNLLSNAVKYNRRGGEVRIAARRNGHQVELSVADTGQGLTADQLERLFTPFERLGAQHGQVGGAGLGLSLSRQLARVMGGEIRVASEPGVGSRFTLTLPAA